MREMGGNEISENTARIPQMESLYSSWIWELREREREWERGRGRGRGRGGECQLGCKKSVWNCWLRLLTKQNASLPTQKGALGSSHPYSPDYLLLWIIYTYLSHLPPIFSFSPSSLFEPIWVSQPLPSLLLLLF